MCVLKEDHDLKEEVERLRNEVEQLKQQKERELKDEISSPSGEENSGSSSISRRDFMKAAAGGAAGLAASAMIGNASAFRINSDQGFSYYNRTSSNPNFEIDTSGNLDLKGNDISNVGSIDIGSISGSRRVGTSVFFDPSRPGRYTDGQDALADVPPSGELVLLSDWDVATEWTIRVEKEISIRVPQSRHGDVVIINTGGDATSGPVVHFDGSSVSGGIEGPKLQNVSIIHSGIGNALRFTDATKSVVLDSVITGNSATMVEYRGKSFFATMTRSDVNGFTGTGVVVRGTGYAHNIISCNISTSQDGATAIEMRRPRSLIIGGEIASMGTDGTAIEFHNPETDQTGTRETGTVIRPGIENTDYPIQINPNGTAAFNNISIIDTLQGMNSLKTAYTFGHTFYSTVRNAYHPGSGQLARFSSDSGRNEIAAPSDTWEDVTVTMNGGNSNVGRVIGGTGDGQLSSFPPNIALTMGYDVTQARPVFQIPNNGWYTINGTSFTP